MTLPAPASATALAPITLTREAWKKFAPGCPANYTEALFGNIDLLEQQGILETELRWCHFAGTIWAETGNFKYLRESLYYTTLKALRKAWPSRFNPMSDAEAKTYLRNPKKLGAKAYNGRMGNRLGSSDGYDFRGGGWIQTTGRYAVETYCKKLGITAGPQTLDDPLITLQFAVLEWTEENCNKWADENDILKIAKAINTGSADSKVTPNGMDNRRAGFARAWNLWGEYDGDAANVAAKPTSKKAIGAIATGAASVVSLVSQTVPTAIDAVSSDPIGTAEKVVTTGQRARSVAEQGAGLYGWMSAGVPVSLLAALAGGAALFWVVCFWLPKKLGAQT